MQKRQINKLSNDQISQIRSMYNQGLSQNFIRRKLGIRNSLVRYHIERVKLDKFSQLSKKSPIKTGYLQALIDELNFLHS